jgi:hypothetical protein
MSELTALDKVDAAIAAGIRAGRSDLHVFSNRSENDEFAEDELPGVNIRILDVRMEIVPDQTAQLWSGTLQLDLVSGKDVGESIDSVNRRTAADIIAIWGADRTLGGRLLTLEETGLSGAEADGAAVGSAILEAHIQFYTPRGDAYTVVGHGGQRF